jgi:predicted amidohydrolase YtcJ
MQKVTGNINTDLLKIPPFRDSHIHFTVDGKPASMEDLLKIKDEYLRSGIFSVDDMGHVTGIGLKAKISPGRDIIIRTAGFAIYKKGTYGAFLGRGVAEKDGIKRVIKYITDAGADFIKVVNSGIVCTKGTELITEGGFSPEELKIIYGEAKEKNMELVCHANSDVAIRNSVCAGASSIEHGFFVSRETLHMMAEAGISWTPTCFALLSLTSELSSSERKYIMEVIDNHLISINYAVSIGVKLNIGTDSGSRGVRHGKSFFDEMHLFRKAGLSVEQILSAACVSKKEIEKGNFLLVKKDFIETRKIEAVYNNGVEVIF